MLANDKFALEDQLRLFGAALDVADAVPVPHLPSALRVSTAESRLARNSSFKKGLEEVYRDVALSKPSWNNGIVTINNEIGGTLKAIGECPHECAAQVSDAIAHLKETRGLKEGDALREFEKKYAEVKAEQRGINRGVERWQEIAETSWRITCENGGRLRGSGLGFGSKASPTLSSFFGNNDNFAKRNAHDEEQKEIDVCHPVIKRPLSKKHDYLSKEGLVYGFGDGRKGKSKEHRIIHVKRHEVDDLEKHEHGVFNSDSLELTEEAWRKIKNNQDVVFIENSMDRKGYVAGRAIVLCYGVDMKRDIGYLGGEIGKELGYPRTTWLKLCIKKGNRVVTSFPIVSKVENK